MAYFTSRKYTNNFDKDQIDVGKKSTINEENLNCNIEPINYNNKKKKQIGIYLRSENFNTRGSNSQENTESNEENSKFNLNKKNINSSKQIIKTDGVKNSTLHSIKERIFWSKKKMKDVRNKLNHAKNLIKYKEKNEFDQIFGWIENDNREEFL